MKSANQALSLAVAFLGGALVSGCSSGAHSTATRPQGSATTSVYLAQSAAACTQTDSTMLCCIKKHPANAAEACGAAPWEIADTLATLKGVDEPEREHDDEGEGEGTPEWKKKCMELYSDCQQFKWRGNCGDCFRFCEGQRGQWPFKKCRER